MVFEVESTQQKWRDENINARIKDWQEESNHIKKVLLDYDWEYRKKICTSCSVKTQNKLKCFRVDNFKDGIQETHCKKMDKARTQKYKKTIMNFITFHPSVNVSQNF